MYDKRSVNFRSGDIVVLEKHFQPLGVQVGTVIRQLVATYVDELKTDEKITDEMMKEIIG